MTSEDVICSAGSFFGAHRESFHRPLTSNGKEPKMGDYETQQQVRTGDTRRVVKQSSR
jgi:hypothetical protein